MDRESISKKAMTTCFVPAAKRPLCVWKYHTYLLLTLQIFLLEFRTRNSFFPIIYMIYVIVPTAMCTFPSEFRSFDYNLKSCLLQQRRVFACCCLILDYSSTKHSRQPLSTASAAQTLHVGCGHCVCVGLRQPGHLPMRLGLMRSRILRLIRQTRIIAVSH